MEGQGIVNVNFNKRLCWFSLKVPCQKSNELYTESLKWNILLYTGYQHDVSNNKFQPEDLQARGLAPSGLG